MGELERLLLLRGERAQAATQVGPVNLGAVEVDTVDAGKADLAVHHHAAAAAHASAVEHDRVERHGHRHVVGRHGLHAGAHHGDGAHGKGMVDLTGLGQALQRTGGKALLAVGAVIGHNDDIGALDCAELVLKHEQVAATSSHDGTHLGAGLRQRTCHGVCGRQAHAAARHSPALPGDALHVGGVPQRTGHVEQLLALLEGREQLGRASHHEEHELNPALLGVPVTERKRHTLGSLACAHQEELSGLRLGGNGRRLHAHEPRALRQKLLLQNSMHGSLPVSIVRLSYVRHDATLARHLSPTENR